MSFRRLARVALDETFIGGALGRVPFVNPFTNARRFIDTTVAIFTGSTRALKKPKLTSQRSALQAGTIRNQRRSG